MKMICKTEALGDGDEKIMQFTKGATYDFEESIDPPGWGVLDDNGKKEVFFRPEVMFERTQH